MKFTGVVRFRSSVNPNLGPPGETEIQELNPSRRETILAITGWPTLASGTLNLEVENLVIEALERIEPLWTEDLSTVVYPESYKHIPTIREFYDYYSATAIMNVVKQEILVRKAKNPVPNRVELLAPVSLTELYGLEEGQRLSVTVYESSDSAEQPR